MENLLEQTAQDTIKIIQGIEETNQALDYLRYEGLSQKDYLDVCRVKGSWGDIMKTLGTILFLAIVLGSTAFFSYDVGQYVTNQFNEATQAIQEARQWI